MVGKSLRKDLENCIQTHRIKGKIFQLKMKSTSDSCRNPYLYFSYYSFAFHHTGKLVNFDFKFQSSNLSRS